MEPIRAARASTPVVIDRQKNCVMLSYEPQRIGYTLPTYLMLTYAGRHRKKEKPDSHGYTLADVRYIGPVGFRRVTLLAVVDDCLTREQ